MGFYSSWGCIFSTLVFDWGSIIISEGWGCIQEWVCIQADMVVSCWSASWVLLGLAPIRAQFFSQHLVSSDWGKMVKF